MKHFHDLNVWQEAHQLTLSIYKATAGFPREEMFAITSQLRRAVVSIEANIAEGHGRFSKSEFHHSCNIARGSLAETQCLLMVARDLGYLSGDVWQTLQQRCVIIAQLPNGFMRHLREV